MHELHAILDAWRGREAEGADAVLATVVHVSGSAYRRPGARMLLLPHGQRIGTVSGGCLEGEIARRAWWYTESPQPVVRVYDTSSGDGVVWEFGLGCNGVVSVMLERVESPSTRSLLEFLHASRTANQTVAVATVISAGSEAPARIGDRLFVQSSGIHGGTLHGGRLASEIHEHAVHVLRDGRHRLAHVGGCDVFVEYIAPPLSLVVLGAGDDARPLVTIASQLGWHVTVADGRPSYARPERFPTAAQVLLVPRVDPLGDVAIDERTVVIMMTHNYPLDTSLLPLVLERRPRYLGLLGPRSRAEHLFDDLGLTMTPNVHAPVGLDVGADTPAAVALSIAAEIQAVVAGRSGAMLRTRHAPIHAPALEAGDEPSTGRLQAERPSYCETLTGEHAA